MHQRVIFMAQEIAEAEKAGNIPHGLNLTPDYVQADQSQALMLHRASERGICRQHIYVPPLALSDLTQTEDDSAGAAEAGVTSYVQQSELFHLLIPGDTFWKAIE